jgi:alpha(1,3/1,4) fucosyltransferase
MKRPIIAINYYFTEKDYNNRVFLPKSTASGLKAFRKYMDERGFDVVTLDTVDFNDPNVKYVLYFEYNWRMLFKDPFLKRVPYRKRALVLLEPAVVNPTLYYTSLLRRRFSVVFTWDWKLLDKNPNYFRINVPVGAEPRTYRVNPFSEFSFLNKRFLVAVSSNRWHYMPQATFGLRRKVYRYFERRHPDDFDLFGNGWSQPRIGYEKWLGHSTLKAWRGTIPGGWDEKVSQLAKYKFSICFENSTGQPGYISEKMLDCFCARCVPVYYGSEGVERLIPKDAWINFRDFRDLDELTAFLEGMSEIEYSDRIMAIERFLNGDQMEFFSTDYFHRVLAGTLAAGC